MPIVQFRKSELLVRHFLNSEIPPTLASDQMVPCLCAFQYRFLLRCTSAPLPRSPELRRCVGRDFFRMRASDNPTSYKVRLPCDGFEACPVSRGCIILETPRVRPPTHNGSAPEVRIIDINVLRSDVEVPAHDQITGSFFRNTSAKALVPMQFVLVRRRPDGLSVRRINRKHAQVVDARGDQPCLWIDHFIAKRRTNAMQHTLRKNRHAVV